MNGKTILFVHPSDELYGADRCLLELVRGLPPTTRLIAVLPRDLEYTGELSRELTAAGVAVRDLDFAVLRRDGLRLRYWPALARRLLAGTWELAKLARDERADVVHTNTLAAVSGPLAACMARRAHVWHVHEDIRDEAWPIKLAFRMLALLPGRVIANSRATATALAGPFGVLHRKTTVVYPGIDTRGRPEPKAASEHAGDALRVAFVGRLSPRKGVTELLEAVAHVRDQGIALQLEIFGTAPPGQDWREGQYRRRAEGLGIGDVVRFAGFVADVRRKLTSVDVLVVPSQRPEPFGRVILEGMAAGCAVVACRTGGGSDEIIEDGVAGLYCGSEPEEIANAIGRLARDFGLRARLGAQATASVQARFSLDAYCNGIMRVYREMLR
ncbi:MAG TPA: glycosyltransferase family 4 protein [Thermomicrobiales bacterium]|nr:glycosyltransferase family 4 protein [Thermomicrobiales bacterium]